MKKYIGILFVLGLLIAPAFSFAQVGDVDPNPTASDCVALQNNLRYRDRDINKNGEVSTFQDFLQMKGFLNSEPTGYFGLLTFQAAKDYQRSKSITPTGYVGLITRAAINAECGGIIPPVTDDLGCSPGQNYSSKNGQLCTSLGCYGEKYSRTTGQMCYGGTTTTTANPVISGVSGPQQLNIRQQGTWTIKASDKSNGTLNYSVIWGDEIYPLSSTASNLSIKETKNQSATFTHTYNGGGTYSPKFTVTNESGQSASTSLSVNVGNITSTNSNPVLGLIAVPESVNVGQSVNFNFSATDVDNDNLSWGVSWGDNRGEGMACPVLNPEQKQDWTYNTSHTWDMAGTYNVKVSVSDCRGGTASTSFSVKVTDVDLAPPVFSSLSGPQLLKVGEQGKWEIKASDSIKTAQLLYSVVWGDEAITGVPITASNDIKLVGQTATFTHTYNTPGIYRPEFEVSRVIMCLVAPCPNGPSAKASLSVDVREIAIKNSVSLNSALEKQD